MKSATTENFPQSLLGSILDDKHYYFTEDELIPGFSIVLNKAGSIYLYMGDDMRREPSQQIIVNDFNGNLYFLSMDCKKSFTLKTIR